MRRALRGDEIMMDSVDFIDFLEEKGHEKAGLCMFAPAILASIANRLLKEAYGNGGDNNLSVPMCDAANKNRLRFIGGNYAWANLVHVKNSIDAFNNIPGAVMLIAELGIGAGKAQTLGLLQNGKLEKFEENHHSFNSFAEDHLSLKRCEEKVQDTVMAELAKKARQGEVFQIGTDEEVADKRELLTAIDNLDGLVTHAVATQLYGRIGHNQPPPEMSLPRDLANSVILNINIIKSEIRSASPDAPNVLDSATNLRRAGEEVIDFFQRTSEHLKSDGSRALAATIISGILWTFWLAIKWISTVLVFPI